MRFQAKFFKVAIALFFLELFIALFVNDQIIRPYIGDLLVVILIYYFLQSFFELNVKITVWAVWLFAVLIEVLQYIKVIEILNLQDYRIAKMILGTSFSWEDIVMYTIGILIVYIIETKCST